MVEQLHPKNELSDKKLFEAETEDVPSGDAELSVDVAEKVTTATSMFTPDRYLESLVRVQTSDGKSAQDMRSKYKGLDVRSSESAEGREWRVVAAGVELTIAERDGVYEYQIVDGEGETYIGIDMKTEAELEQMWKEFRQSVDQHKADSAMKRARRLARRKLGI